MKKFMLIFAAAVITLGANAQGDKKETKPAPAKKEAAPAKKDDKAAANHLGPVLHCHPQHALFSCAAVWFYTVAV